MPNTNIKGKHLPTRAKPHKMFSPRIVLFCILLLYVISTKIYASLSSLHSLDRDRLNFLFPATCVNGIFTLYEESSIVLTFETRALEGQMIKNLNHSIPFTSLAALQFIGRCKESTGDLAFLSSAAQAEQDQISPKQVFICPVAASNSNTTWQLLTSSNTTFSTSLICEPCPRGYYCPNPLVTTSPVATGNAIRSQYSNTPLVCPQGMFSRSAGATSCSPCPNCCSGCDSVMGICPNTSSSTPGCVIEGLCYSNGSVASNTAGCSYCNAELTPHNWTLAMVGTVCITEETVFPGMGCFDPQTVLTCSTNGQCIRNASLVRCSSAYEVCNQTSIDFGTACTLNASVVEQGVCKVTNNDPSQLGCLLPSTNTNNKMCVPFGSSPSDESMLQTLFPAIVPLPSPLCISSSVKQFPWSPETCTGQWNLITGTAVCDCASQSNAIVSVPSKDNTNNNLASIGADFKRNVHNVYSTIDIVSALNNGFTFADTQLSLARWEVLDSQNNSFVPGLKSQSICDSTAALVCVSTPNLSSMNTISSCSRLLNPNELLITMDKTLDSTSIQFHWTDAANLNRTFLNRTTFSITASIRVLLSSDYPLDSVNLQLSSVQGPVGGSAPLIQQQSSFSNLANPNIPDSSVTGSVSNFLYNISQGGENVGFVLNIATLRPPAALSSANFQLALSIEIGAISCPNPLAQLTDRHVVLSQQASHSLNQQYAVGEFVSFACAEGFVFAPGSGYNSTCQENGQWSVPYPSCIAVQCGILEPVLSPAKFSNPIGTYATVSQILCPVHYVPNWGNITFRCEQDQLWHPTADELVSNLNTTNTMNATQLNVTDVVYGCVPDNSVCSLSLASCIGFLTSDSCNAQTQCLWCAEFLTQNNTSNNTFTQVQPPCQPLIPCYNDIRGMDLLSCNSTLITFEETIPPLTLDELLSMQNLTLCADSTLQQILVTVDMLTFLDLSTIHPLASSSSFNFSFNSSNSSNPVQNGSLAFSINNSTADLSSNDSLGTVSIESFLIAQCASFDAVQCQQTSLCSLCSSPYEAPVNDLIGNLTVANVSISFNLTATSSDSNINNNTSTNSTTSKVFLPRVCAWNGLYPAVVINSSSSVGMLRLVSRSCAVISQPTSQGVLVSLYPDPRVLANVTAPQQNQTASPICPAYLTLGDILPAPTIVTNISFIDFNFTITEPDLDQCDDDELTCFQQYDNSTCLDADAQSSLNGTTTCIWCPTYNHYGACLTARSCKLTTAEWSYSECPQSTLPQTMEDLVLYQPPVQFCQQIQSYNFTEFTSACKSFTTVDECNLQYGCQYCNQSDLGLSSCVYSPPDVLCIVSYVDQTYQFIGMDARCPIVIVNTTLPAPTIVYDTTCKLCNRSVFPSIDALQLSPFLSMQDLVNLTLNGSNIDSCSSYWVSRCANVLDSFSCNQFSTCLWCDGTTLNPNGTCLFSPMETCRVGTQSYSRSFGCIPQCSFAEVNCPFYTSSLDCEGNGNDNFCTWCGNSSTCAIKRRCSFGTSPAYICSDILPYPISDQALLLNSNTSDVSMIEHCSLAEMSVIDQCNQMNADNSRLCSSSPECALCNIPSPYNPGENQVKCVHVQQAALALHLNSSTYNSSLMFNQSCRSKGYIYLPQQCPIFSKVDTAECTTQTELVVIPNCDPILTNNCQNLTYTQCLNNTWCGWCMDWPTVSQDAKFSCMYTPDTSNSCLLTLSDTNQTLLTGVGMSEADKCPIPLPSSSSSLNNNNTAENDNFAPCNPSQLRCLSLGSADSCNSQFSCQWCGFDSLCIPFTPCYSPLNRRLTPIDCSIGNCNPQAVSDCQALNTSDSCQSAIGLAKQCSWCYNESCSYTPTDHSCSIQSPRSIFIAGPASVSIAGHGICPASYNLVATSNNGAKVPTCAAGQIVCLSQRNSSSCLASSLCNWCPDYEQCQPLSPCILDLDQSQYGGECGQVNSSCPFYGPAVCGHYPDEESCEISSTLPCRWCPFTDNPNRNGSCLYNPPSLCTQSLTTENKTKISVTWGDFNTLCSNHSRLFAGTNVSLAPVNIIQHTILPPLSFKVTIRAFTDSHSGLMFYNARPVMNLSNPTSFESITTFDALASVVRVDETIYPDFIQPSDSECINCKVGFTQSDYPVFKLPFSQPVRSFSKYPLPGTNFLIDDLIHKNNNKYANINSNNNNPDHEDASWHALLQQWLRFDFHLVNMPQLINLNNPLQLKDPVLPQSYSSIIQYQNYSTTTVVTTYEKRHVLGSKKLVSVPVQTTSTTLIRTKTINQNQVISTFDCDGAALYYLDDDGRWSTNWTDCFNKTHDSIVDFIVLDDNGLYLNPVKSFQMGLPLFITNLPVKMPITCQLRTTNITSVSSYSSTQVTISVLEGNTTTTSVQVGPDLEYYSHYPLYNDLTYILQSFTLHTAATDIKPAVRQTVQKKVNSSSIFTNLYFEVYPSLLAVDDDSNNDINSNNKDDDNNYYKGGFDLLNACVSNELSFMSVPSLGGFYLPPIESINASLLIPASVIAAEFRPERPASVIPASIIAAIQYGQRTILTDENWHCTAVPINSNCCSASTARNSLIQPSHASLELPYAFIDLSHMNVSRSITNASSMLPAAQWITVGSQNQSAVTQAGFNVFCRVDIPPPLIMRAAASFPTGTSSSRSRFLVYVNGELKSSNDFSATSPNSTILLSPVISVPFEMSKSIDGPVLPFNRAGSNITITPSQQPLSSSIAYRVTLATVSKTSPKNSESSIPAYFLASIQLGGIKLLSSIQWQCNQYRFYDILFNSTSVIQEAVSPQKIVFIPADRITQPLHHMKIDIPSLSSIKINETLSSVSSPLYNFSNWSTAKLAGSNYGLRFPKIAAIPEQAQWLAFQQEIESTSNTSAVLLTVCSYDIPWSTIQDVNAISVNLALMKDSSTNASSGSSTANMYFPSMVASNGTSIAPLHDVSNSSTAANFAGRRRLLSTANRDSIMDDVFAHTYTAGPYPKFQVGVLAPNPDLSDGGVSLYNYFHSWISDSPSTFGVYPAMEKCKLELELYWQSYMFQSTCGCPYSDFTEWYLEGDGPFPSSRPGCPFADIQAHGRIAVNLYSSNTLNHVGFHQFFEQKDFFSGASCKDFPDLTEDQCLFPYPTQLYPYDDVKICPGTDQWTQYGVAKKPVPVYSYGTGKTAAYYVLDSFTFQVASVPARMSPFYLYRTSVVAPVQAQCNYYASIDQNDPNPFEQPPFVQNYPCGSTEVQTCCLSCDPVGYCETNYFTHSPTAVSCDDPAIQRNTFDRMIVLPSEVRTFYITMLFVSCFGAVTVDPINFYTTPASFGSGVSISPISALNVSSNIRQFITYTESNAGCNLATAAAHGATYETRLFEIEISSMQSVFSSYVIGPRGFIGIVKPGPQYKRGEIAALFSNSPVVVTPNIFDNAQVRRDLTQLTAPMIFSITIRNADVGSHIPANIELKVDSQLLPNGLSLDPLNFIDTFTLLLCNTQAICTIDLNDREQFPFNQMRQFNFSLKWTASMNFITTAGFTFVYQITVVADQDPSLSYLDILAAGSSASLIHINPNFDPNLVHYNFTLPRFHVEPSLTLKSNLSDIYASAQVLFISSSGSTQTLTSVNQDDEEFRHRDIVLALPTLQFGHCQLFIIVTDDTGFLQRNYTIDLFLDHDHDKAISFLQPNIGYLDPAFDSTNHSYTLTLYDFDTQPLQILFSLHSTFSNVIGTFFSTLNNYSMYNCTTNCTNIRNALGSQLSVLPTAQCGFDYYVAIDSPTLPYGKSLVQLNVTADDGSSILYSFQIFRQTSRLLNILSTPVAQWSSTFDPTQLTYQVAFDNAYRDYSFAVDVGDVASSIQFTYQKVGRRKPILLQFSRSTSINRASNNPISTYTVQLPNVPFGNSALTITIISADNTRSQTYYIFIVRRLNATNGLSSLSIDKGDSTYLWRLNQPFLPSQIADYAISLDPQYIMQSIEAVTLTLLVESNNLATILQTQLVSTVSVSIAQQLPLPNDIQMYYNSTLVSPGCFNSGYKNALFQISAVQLQQTCINWLKSQRAVQENPSLIATTVSYRLNFSLLLAEFPVMIYLRLLDTDLSSVISQYSFNLLLGASADSRMESVWISLGELQANTESADVGIFAFVYYLYSYSILVSQDEISTGGMQLVAQLSDSAGATLTALLKFNQNDELVMTTRFSMNLWFIDIPLTVISINSTSFPATLLVTVTAANRQTYTLYSFTFIVLPKSTALNFDTSPADSQNNPDIGGVVQVDDGTVDPSGYTHGNDYGLPPIADPYQNQQTAQELQQRVVQLTLKFNSYFLFDGSVSLTQIVSLVQSQVASAISCEFNQIRCMILNDLQSMVLLFLPDFTESKEDNRIVYPIQGKTVSSAASTNSHASNPRSGYDLFVSLIRQLHPDRFRGSPLSRGNITQHLQPQTKFNFSIGCMQNGAFSVSNGVQCKIAFDSIQPIGSSTGNGIFIFLVLLGTVILPGLLFISIYWWNRQMKLTKATQYFNHALPKPEQPHIIAP